MRIVVGDIEADGLYQEWDQSAATRIDCLYLDIDGDGVSLGGDKSGVEAVINTGDTLVFHNGIDYDLRMLKKFWGIDYSVMPDTFAGMKVKHVDTMILSKLLWPDLLLPKGFSEKWKPSYKGESMPGPHSLDVWAFRLGMKKPKLVYGDKMGKVPFEVSIAQAKADVEITKALFLHLVEECKKRGVDYKRPSAIEHKVRDIISHGAEIGVVFDKELAEKSIIELDEMMEELAKKVEPMLPRRDIPKSRLKNPPGNKFKKNGEPHANAEKYFGDLLRLDSDKGKWVVDYPDGTVLLAKADKPLVTTEPMKIGDNADIKQWLMDQYGWKPTLWNFTKGEDGRKKKTSPKIQEQGKLCRNLEALGEEVEFVNDVCKYMSCRNRRSVIKSENGTGWLNHPRLGLDGKIPSDADTMGTVTFRFTHRGIANIPRKSSFYGEVMRGLFTVPDGYVLVGWDASGLEDRVKAHYTYDMLGGREYAEKILDPDFSVHEENMKAWGLPKPKCKNGHYAMQYNCRAPKLAETLGVPQAQADEYYEAWWANNEPLRYFMDKAVQVWMAHGKKWLPSIDGRLVPVSMEYMLTSRLFQSAGVIAMKYAMVLWEDRIRKMKLPAEQIIHYHDEAQAMVPEEFADEVGEIGCWSIQKAGEILNFKVPLLSEYDIGRTWADTH